MNIGGKYVLKKNVLRDYFLNPDEFPVYPADLDKAGDDETYGKHRPRLYELVDAKKEAEIVAVFKDAAA